MGSALIQLSSGRPAFVWRENTGESQGRGASSGRERLPRAGAGVVQLSLGLCSRSFSSVPRNLSAESSFDFSSATCRSGSQTAADT